MRRLSTARCLGCVVTRATTPVANPAEHAASRCYVRGMKRTSGLAVLIVVLAGACGGAGKARVAAPEPTTAPPAEEKAAEPVGAPPIEMIAGKAGHVCWSENRQALEHYDRGVRLYDEGSAVEAVAAYQQALELDPRFCDAMDNLAV